MNPSAQTTGERLIEQLMQQLDPASDRYKILASARLFKASWVDLGEKLLLVRKHGLHQQWGYDDFDSYCQREIRIRKPTAEKLTQAYRYLEEEEPQLLARRDELRPLPDFRSIDLLRQAREEEHLNGEDYDGLRRAIIDEDRSHPTVLKRFRDLLAERGNGPTPLERCRQALSAARRLVASIDEVDSLPVDCREQADNLVNELQAEVERLQAQSAEPVE